MVWYLYVDGVKIDVYFIGNYVSMTTIIVDVKAQKVYSDTLITTNHNHTVVINRITGSTSTIKSWSHFNHDSYPKMYKHRDYVIVGCGDMDVLAEFNKMYPDDIPEPLNPAVILVICKRHQGIAFLKYETIEKAKSKFSWLSNKNKSKLEWKITSRTTNVEWLTYGSGREYALGALIAGATPTEAIQLTSTVDISTGSDVVCMDIP